MAKKSIKQNKNQNVIQENATENLIGKEVTISQDGTDFFGKVVSERNTTSGNQFFLKLNGLVSRWFNADCVKSEKGL